MTTTQAAPNGHRVSPPPCSLENPAEANPADLPANEANINPSPLPSQISDLSSPDATPAASAYHVPPQRFAPKAHPYRQDDTLDLPPETSPLPERCQFMFSDGRQCTMARSEIHPSLCRYHSEREEQLFGAPSPGSKAVAGAAFDLPELFSACADLSSALGVNRALAQVFRLLAQRRISRQEAATFAKLGHLLLQTIRAARMEVPSESPDRGAEFAPQPLFRQTSPGPSQQPKVPYSRSNPPGASLAPDNTSRAVILSESARADESKDPSASVPVSASLSMPPNPASLEPPTQRVASGNSPKINTSVPSIRNSPEISRCKNAGDQVARNEHLQKNKGDCLVYAR